MDIGKLTFGAPPRARLALRSIALAAVLSLTACGGGGGADGAGGSSPETASAAETARSTPLSASDAARFLTQATYGPAAAEISRLSNLTYGAWIDEQFAKPQVLHRLTMNQAAADLAANGGTISQSNFFDSYWSQAIAGDDQLRQRAAFALSQIFVISFTDSLLRSQPRGVASYYDMLGEKAFGNFRDLLEGVALHPMMGVYLTWLKNQKEDPATGRVPDLNFAREVTQLFTLGEWKLQPDGTVIKDASGRPVAAYVAADLEALSRVFTGYSWYAGASTSDRTSRRFQGLDANLERDWRPMQPYNGYASNTDYHSLSEKSFLGTTIAAGTRSDPEGDLKIALDTLFNHPNVGPFIGRQLIQRLVTSNPSPAYVGRVSAAFNDNGSGMRGDMKALWKAILLDPEARAASTSASYGKLREPLVRLANFMRAFNVKSDSGRFGGIGNTDDAGSRLNQTPMAAPTVFNFYSPGYVPTSQSITSAHLVAPELQITHDVSVAGYMNYIKEWITVKPDRDLRQDYSAELALAETPDALVERMNLLLFSGQLPDALRAQIVAAVVSRVIPAPVYDKVVGADGVERDGGAKPPAGGAGAAAGAASAPAAVLPDPKNKKAIEDARLDRVCIAIYLSMVSPDYLIQK